MKTLRFQEAGLFVLSQQNHGIVSLECLLNECLLYLIHSYVLKRIAFLQAVRLIQASWLNQSFHAATITKLIKEILPEDVKCANETRDLIMECCVGKFS
jgi:hypothetical protein